MVWKEDRKPMENNTNKKWNRGLAMFAAGAAFMLCWAVLFAIQLAKTIDTLQKPCDIGADASEVQEGTSCKQPAASPDGQPPEPPAYPDGQAEPVQSQAEPGQPPAPAESKPAESPFVRVVQLDFAGENGDEILIRLDSPPVAADFLRYIAISPRVEDVSVEIREEQSWYWREKARFSVRLKSANFKYRTPYTITLKREMPFEADAALESDFRRTITRDDMPSEVSLADTGRYLPPVGDSLLAITVANAPRLKYEFRRVLSENIVQLLAREERQYTKSIPFWWSEVSADSEASEELAAEPFCWEEELATEPNMVERRYVRLRDGEGKPKKGVYLFSVQILGKKLRDTPEPEYRLVCLTDLGLTVRRDENALRVWVTSLSTGRCVPGATAKLYASNRLLLASGVTDGNGETTLADFDTRYEPFALVVESASQDDITFMALKDSMHIDESMPCGKRPQYLKPNDLTAFLWTDRGIYRHGEKIMAGAILRNGEGAAPSPLPVKFVFADPKGREVAFEAQTTDQTGAVTVESFSAPANMPSGKWKLKVVLPGQDATTLGEREIKIEEFAPPQVKVEIKALPRADEVLSNVTWKVHAEHLFGGAAKQLSAEGMVVFADAAFSPSGWKDWRFGDPRRSLGANFTRLPARFTDEKGEAVFSLPLKPEWGKPAAAVKMTVQGSVTETGGRPATARASTIFHLYPYYIGSDVPESIKSRNGLAFFNIATLAPDGKPIPSPLELKARLYKIGYAYNLVKKNDSTACWDSEETRSAIGDEIRLATGADGKARFAIPANGSGEYEFTVEDAESGVSHSVRFWISSGDDAEVRAKLKTPTAVTLSPDKKAYCEGERPLIAVKSPFRGMAYLAVMREKTLYTRIFELTNATTTVELDPLEKEWAPNVDVAISVVQPVEASSGRLATRAHGIISLPVRPKASLLDVEITPNLVLGSEGGGTLEVAISAKNALANGEIATITVVDEGINLLTAEQVPAPSAFFATERSGFHPLYDVYSRLLPAYDSHLVATGMKTGGDGMADIMNRVSPVPTRRFKPLSLWQRDVPLVDGECKVKFNLPEFSGTVRITAVATGRRATGSAAKEVRVCPKLLVQGDAPRFAAPGDAFALTLALSNRSGKDGTTKYHVAARGTVTLEGEGAGEVFLADGETKVLSIPAKAAMAVGEGAITFEAAGLGESHSSLIELPVRPGATWCANATTIALKPGEKFVSRLENKLEPLAALSRRTVAVASSPVAELVSAYDYLAEYPHGCLEQTVSRIFPLIYAGGFLNLIPSEKSSKAAELDQTVKAGMERVASMVRENDFTVWPDVTCAPWDREVSLYAAHFLAEAKMSGHALPSRAEAKMFEFLKKWVLDSDLGISAYACHTLALLGAPEKDRMFSLYDARAKLPLIDRARLARAFTRIGDAKRARDLLAVGSIQPNDVKDAAFALIALDELDSADPAIDRLALFLQEKRDGKRFHWGTTMGNAHALLALGAYYRRRGITQGEAKVEVKMEGEEKGVSLAKKEHATFLGKGDITIENTGVGTAFVSVKGLTLPSEEAAAANHNVVRVERNFFTSEGFPADLENLTRGELLIAEITLSSDIKYDFSDLVIEDLFPAAMEPERASVADAFARWHGKGDRSWVLRSDTRDDRVIVYSRPVTISPEAPEGEVRKFFHALRVVTPGDFVLPGVRVEAMYAPEIFAETAPARIRIKE